MPEKQTLERARRDRQQGKAPTTQAGEFIREEMHHIREGKHGARSTRQAIAIGLSKARRAGVQLQPPRPGTTSEKTRRTAERELKRAHDRPRARPSARRSRAAVRALKRENGRAASAQALSRQARSAARQRSASSRSAAARKAARTQGARQRSTAARKAAHTRSAGGR